MLLAVAATAASAQQTGQPQAQPEQPGQEQMTQPGQEPMARERPGRGIIGIVPAVTAPNIGAPAELVIRQVQPYTPAYDAGLMPGDRIVSVGGQAVEGRSLSDVVRMIRGDVGTPVTLTVERDDQSRVVELIRVMPVDRDRGRGRNHD